MIIEHEIIELKTNHISKGLIPLERLFDNNDFFMKLQLKVQKKAPWIATWEQKMSQN